MKKMIFVALLVLVAPVFAAEKATEGKDHTAPTSSTPTNNTSTSGERTEAIKDRSGDLFTKVSACLSGRPADAAEVKPATK